MSTHYLAATGRGPLAAGTSGAPRIETGEWHPRARAPSLGARGGEVGRAAVQPERAHPTPTPSAQRRMTGMPAAYCAPTGGMEPEARRCSWTSRPPISTRVAGWRCGLIRDLVGSGTTAPLILALLRFVRRAVGRSDPARGSSTSTSRSSWSVSGWWRPATLRRHEHRQSVASASVRRVPSTRSLRQATVPDGAAG